jgi:hypothetical protein
MLKKASEDKEFRLQLAKSIGLTTLPEYDSEAFTRLSGIIVSKIKDKKFNSVEVIKEIRNGLEDEYHERAEWSWLTER